MKILQLLLVIIFGLTGPGLAGAKTPAGAPSMLPEGYLTTSGSQITDLAGHNVRLACVGYAQPTSNITTDLQAIRADGFNCVRYPWYDATLTANLKTADKIVAAAKKTGIKVILDHHADETPSKNNDYLPYNANGLPIDKGPGTNGTDGWCTAAGECDKGTVTVAKFVNDWTIVAKHYAGNSTVIGFDLANEPHLNPFWYASNPGGATWNTGAPTDLRIMYENAGNAILKVDPGVLIIAEGILNWTAASLNGNANPIAGYPDLTTAETFPVILNVNGKLVYSIHDYPFPISNTTPDSGTVKVTTMNANWGYLVSQNIAPVWIGEMGASLDGIGPDSQGNLTPTSAETKLSDEQAWVATMVSYLNGQDGAKGGPSFTGCQTGVSTDWWSWGNFDGEAPDGTLGDSGTPRPEQQAVTQQLAFVPKAGC